MFKTLGIILLVLIVIYLSLGAWQYMCLVIQKEMPLSFSDGLRYILLWPVNWLAR